MKKKNTDGLQQELMDSPDLNQFLSQNQEQFENKSVAELLNRLFEKKHISKAALAKQAGMSEIYLHQIFAGRRNTARNRLLCLCYGLEATVEETETPLSIMGCCMDLNCLKLMINFLRRMRRRCFNSLPPSDA